MNLFDLVAVLTLDKSKYESGLKEASSEATSFGDKVKSGFGTATKVVGALSGVAVAGGAAVMKLATSSASAMDEIDKASQKMNISTTAYQEWAHAMDLSGMSIDTMKTGMKSLQKAMTGVDEDGNATSEEFQKLGISLTDASGNMRSAEDVMNEAILKLSDMEDGAERTAIATKLFGKAGTEMAPMLNQGSEAIEAMKQEAHDLGLVMSEEDVKAGASLNDTLTNLKASFSAIVTKLGASLMPVVQRLGDFLIKIMPKIQDMFDKIAPLLLDLAEQLLPVIMDLAETLLPTITSILETIMPVVSNLVHSLMPIIISALQVINPLLEALNAILKPVLDLVNLLIKPLLDLINFIFGDITEGITGITDLLGGDGILAVLGELVNVAGATFEWFGHLLDDPVAALEEALDGLKEYAIKVFESLVTIVNGIFDLIDAKEDEAEAKEKNEKVRQDLANMESQRGLKLNESNGVASWTIADQDKYLAYYGHDALGLMSKSESAESSKLEISGTITHEGVNDEGELVASADYTMDNLTSTLEKEARLGGY